MNLRSVVVAAALVATAGMSRLAAQGDAEYLALLDRYANGASIDAATALASWPAVRVRTTVRTLESRLPRAKLRTAVMLHTESAFSDLSDEHQFYQLDLARSLLQRFLGSLGPSEPGAKDFASRWHALTAMFHCVRNDEPRARYEINRGRALDANHKYVNLVDNALVEYRIFTMYKGNVQQAALRYREIVSRHPDFFEARLRLGRILMLNGASKNAREELEIVAARATGTDVVYLAHMFLASLHERAKHDADTEREYEAARAVAPYPSALIALIRIAGMRGQTESVRTLAAEIPVMEAAGQDDPWSHYSLCVTGGDLFEGLRADARRP